MEIEGKITKVLPIQTGESAKGVWHKQDYVLTTADQYPKQICFNVFKMENIEKFNIKLNDSVKVHVNLESREYNEKWYTNVQAWRVEKAATQPVHGPEFTSNDVKKADEELNNLPF